MHGPQHTFRIQTPGYEEDGVQGSVHSGIEAGSEGNGTAGSGSDREESLKDHSEEQDESEDEDDDDDDD